MEESDFRVSERPENGETESEDGGHGNFPREIGLGREEGSWRSSCQKKKHFLPSSFNSRTSLSLFKYWWEEARREREQRYHKGAKEAEGVVPQVEGCTPGGRRDTPTTVTRKQGRNEPRSR